MPPRPNPWERGPWAEAESVTLPAPLGAAEWVNLRVDKICEGDNAPDWTLGYRSDSQRDLFGLVDWALVGEVLELVGSVLPATTPVILAGLTPLDRYIVNGWFHIVDGELPPALEGSGAINNGRHRLFELNRACPRRVVPIQKLPD